MEFSINGKTFDNIGFMGVEIEWKIIEGENSGYSKSHVPIRDIIDTFPYYTLTFDFFGDTDNEQLYQFLKIIRNNADSYLWRLPIDGEYKNIRAGIVDGWQEKLTRCIKKGDSEYRVWEPITLNLEPESGWSTIANSR